jgi:hypothetical protein
VFLSALTLRFQHHPMTGFRPAELQALRQELLATELATAPGECFDDVTVASFVDGVVAERAHQDAVRHFSVCGACRMRVASVARGIADPVLVRAFPSRGARAAGLGRISLGAAAVLVLALSLARGRDAPSHRALPSSERVAIARSPLGRVGAIDRFTWSPVVGADRYRIVIFSGDGRAVYEAEHADTVATLPDSVRLTRGAGYFWRVDARTGWDHWVASPLTPFSISR